MKIWRCLAVLLVTIGCGCGEREARQDPPVRVGEQGQLRVGDLEIVPHSQSQQRTALLPTTPSEDMRQLLGKIDLPAPKPPDTPQDYLPDPEVEWVVDVRCDGDPRLDPQAVANAFDKDWRSAFGRCMIYGRDVQTGRWRFLLSSDGPPAVNQLKFAFDYVDVLDEDAPVTDEAMYGKRLEQLKQQMKQFGTPHVTASASPADAVARSRQLKTIHQDLDVSAVLQLRAPPGQRFDGKKVWDTMLCLGLEWGDMDCFHWPNPSGVGDDFFFSVETSTAPGYFLPEEVAAGRVNVEDLVFVFSVPRTAKPVEVFDAMSKGVEYCRSRLGGTIHAGGGSDPAELRAQIVDVEKKLRESGLEPGASATLQLF